VRSTQGGVTIDKNGTVMGNVRAGTTIATAGTIEGTATPNVQSPPIAARTVAACNPFSDASGISGAGTEYAPEWNGYMEGALRSGEAAGDAVAAL
jgi:hypothetical protein